MKDVWLSQPLIKVTQYVILHITLISNTWFTTLALYSHLTLEDKRKAPCTQSMPLNSFCNDVNSDVQLSQNWHLLLLPPGSYERHLREFSRWSRKMDYAMNLFSVNLICILASPKPHQYTLQNSSQATPLLVWMKSIFQSYLKAVYLMSDKNTRLTNTLLHVTCPIVSDMSLPFISLWRLTKKSVFPNVWPSFQGTQIRQ